jgi:hypothetical protein
MTEPTKTRDFAHTHDYNAAAEPPWSSVDVQKLPPECFASAIGDDSTAWRFPHHYVESAAQPDEHGRWSAGTLKVHTQQLLASYVEAEKEGLTLALIHLDGHRKAIDPDLDGHPLRDMTGIKAHTQTVTKPRYAFSAPITLEVGDNGDGAKSAPVTLVALSGEILDRPEWGPCIQDLGGCVHKDRIAIDYMHNPEQIVGYINRFTTDGKLVLSGALVPQKTHHRTEEIIENMKAGVPYEASIYFPPSFPGDLVIEQYEPGEAVQVNGRTVTAPETGLTVFRKFVLRGVAICPHGADGGTAAFLQADTSATASADIRKVPKAGTQQAVTEPEKEKTTMETKEQKPVPAPAPAETQQATPPPAEVEKEKEGEGKEAEDAEELTGWRANLKKFTAKFGADKAVAYLTAGKSYAEALEAYADECRTKMEAAAAQSAPAAATPGKATAQAAKPSIPFEQAGEPDPDGLTAAEVAAFAQYAVERNLTPAQVAKLKKAHRQAQQESRRLGVYERTPGAAPIQEAEGGSLTKIGQE